MPEVSIISVSLRQSFSYHCIVLANKKNVLKEILCDGQAFIIFITDLVLSRFTVSVWGDQMNSINLHSNLIEL